VKRSNGGLFEDTNPAFAWRIWGK